MRLTSEGKKVRQEYGGCLEEVTRLRAETIWEVIIVTQHQVAWRPDPRRRRLRRERGRVKIPRM